MGSNSQGLIRPAESRDAAAIAEIHNHAILNTTATFDVDPKTTADRLAWLESRDERHPVLVFEIGGEAAGWACLTPWSEKKGYEDTVEGSLYIHPDCRNRGYGQQLNAAITASARELGFHTLIARVAGDSDTSIHLCESFGYKHIGTMKEVGRKFDQLLDVHIYQLMLSDETQGAT
jgi:phosphinothricin acetyltransferase